MTPKIEWRAYPSATETVIIQAAIRMNYLPVRFQPQRFAPASLWARIWSAVPFVRLSARLT